MKELLVYLKKYRKEAICAPLFKMLEASFELLVPLVMAAVIDVGIANGDKGYVIKMCLVMIGLGIIGLVCSITAQFFSAKAATGFATGLRSALFSHIQYFSYTKMDTLGASTLITRMTSDVNQVQTGVNLVLRLFLRSPFIVFGAMIMAFTVDVKGALVFVVTIPLLSIVVFGILLITMPLYKNVQDNLDQVLLSTRENLTGVRVLRAFNKEADEIRNFREKNEILTKAHRKVSKISGLMNPVTYVIVNGGLIVLIYIGAVRVNMGVLTQGQVVALINYMSQILVELIKLANLIITVSKAIASGNRIQSIFEETTGMDDSHVRTDEDQKIEHNQMKEKRNPEDVSVQFDHVSMRYEGASADSLSDITFVAKRGEVVGIIGGTGSGKSSVVNLIPRFYDASEGTVLVDGRDVKEYKVDNLREKIGVVPQKAVLFKGTIEENLRWGNQDATAEDIEEALRISQAKEFVDGKDGRLEFLIEQAGRNLSGGQKQRLTIARALVRKPEILILDDSASALDFATDAKLRMALREMKEQPIVFIVSQRASSVRYADQIIVMDDGEMAGIGTHEDLLANCAIYQEIYYSQFPREDSPNADVHQAEALQKNGQNTDVHSVDTPCEHEQTGKGE